MIPPKAQPKAAALPVPPKRPARTIPAELPAISPSELPNLKLQGIIYIPSRPQAMINGQTVTVGDEVGGARIARITPTGVELHYKGGKAELHLK